MIIAKTFHSSVVLSLFLSDWVLTALTDVSSPKRKWRLFHRLNYLFHKIIGVVMIDLNPFWSREVEYEIPIEDLPRSAIYVGNHLSFADAFFYPNAFAQEFVVVAKAASFNDPRIILEVQRLSGVLRVYFEQNENHEWKTQRKRTEIMLQKAVEKLDEGVSIMVFSEGTVSEGGEVLQFKPGMYRLALRTNTPVIPIGSWGTNNALPMGPRDSKGWSQPRPWGHPANVVLKCGAPIDPWDFSFEPYQEAIDKVVSDSANPLTREDFEEQNRDSLGEKLYAMYEYHQTDPLTELLDMFAENFSARVRERVIELKEVAKEKQQRYRKERLESRRRWDKAASKMMNQSFEFSMPRFNVKMPTFGFNTGSGRRSKAKA